MGLSNLFTSNFEFIVLLLASMVKIAIMMGIAINLPPILIWLERRAPALMQRRKGPNRVGVFHFRLWGLLQSLADAIKLIFKEETVPAKANKFFYHLAPVFGLFPAVLALSAIPFAHDITIAGIVIPLSVVKVNVGFLFILAVSSIGVYGITLAGWASNNKFSVLGSLRASAQMISYEIPLGLSLVPLALIFDSLDLSTITLAQEHIWQWGIFRAPVSFLMFIICMFAETNRAPFDLAEGESELVAGFHVEYTSAKFALFYLSEYIAMFALSCFASVLFLGGWQVPFVSFATLASLGGENIASLITFIVLMLKASFFLWLFIWVRWTIPRFRYDQLMKLGWKFLLPVGLANVVVTSLILALNF